MSRIENLNKYLSLISNSYYLSSSSDDADENDNDYSIPVNLVSEENIANKFMENTKALIRSSIEYKHWVKWFKQRWTPVVCSVSDNTTTIEVHHHPLTLEDYVDIALSFIYDNGLTYSTFLISDMVMRWHYKEIVGACYMSKTYHMRFHEKHDIVIPEDCIQWDIDSFMNDDIIKDFKL